MGLVSQTPSYNKRRPIPISDVGTRNSVDGLRVIEYGGPDIQRQTLLLLDAVDVSVSNVTGASFGSKKLYTFPIGRIAIDGCTAIFDVITFSSGIASGGSGDYSIGSAATADATLSGTDVNILPSSAMVDPFTVRTGASNAGSGLSAVTQLDGTGTAIDVYLNVIVDDADVSDAASDTVTFTGAILITWKNLGKYQTRETA